MSTENMVDIVKRYSTTIKNGRTPSSTFTHLQSEVEELDEEIQKLNNGDDCGEDGIIGEAMDIINCALDIVFQVYPNITSEELNAIQERKCKKWADKYGLSD